MKFGIVILSYNQPETTIDCIKSIQAVKPREFSDKQIFVVHNGSDPAVVQELRKRYPRFYHVVLETNEGFAAGANAGLATAFSLHPWVLFLTQDTTLVHFPKSPPFEPCLATVKIYKRTMEKINSIGGAVDLEIAKNYLCPKADLFWNSFESPMLSPYVPRTAFWIHQTPFEKLGGFDENLGTMWEDVEFSLRARREGEMIQLDESTEVIHHRKGICRKDPLYTQYYYNRNRFIVSRETARTKFSQVKFELGLVIEWLIQLLGVLASPTRGFVYHAYPDSRKNPPPARYSVGQLMKAHEAPEAEPTPVPVPVAEKAANPPQKKSAVAAKVSDKGTAKVTAQKTEAAATAEAKTRSASTSTRTESEGTQTRRTEGTQTRRSNLTNSDFKTTILPPKEDNDSTEILPENQTGGHGSEDED